VAGKRSAVSLWRIFGERAAIRSAANVIAVTTIVVVVIGGVLMRLIDGDEYPSVWLGMWWALQTVTTVGYGDVTPEATSGRIIAAFVMLWGVAFLAIVIAAITSFFVAREREKRQAAKAAEGDSDPSGIHARFDDVTARLDRLEAMLASERGSAPPDEAGRPPAATS
jgi:voltage-gated potassium channel Kch